MWNLTRNLAFLCAIVVGVVSSAVAIAQEGVLLPYPEFVSITLKDGLRILVAEHHEQPAVFYRMLLPAGIRDEPRGKEGIASMTTALLTEGTEAKSGQEIADLIDGLGGYLSASSFTEYSVVSCDVLAEDLDVGLGLFAEVILLPTFPGKAVRRVRAQHIAAVKERRTDYFSVATEQAFKQLYREEHRLGRLVTTKSLGRIDAEEVRAFHKKHFLPNGSILLAIGDFSREAMLTKLRASFADWSLGDRPARESVLPRELDGVDFRLVHRPKLTQGTMAFCQWGVARRGEDYPAWCLLDYILGGGVFSSRLMAALRSEQGKTYTISSDIEGYTDHGNWTVLTSTRNETVVATVETVVAELTKLVRNGVTKEELDKAKSYYAGNLPMGLELPKDIATSVLENLYYGDSLEEIPEELAELLDVTLEDINRVAREHLSDEAFVLVVVGDRRELGKPLRRFLEDQAAD